MLKALVLLVENSGRCLNVAFHASFKKGVFLKYYSNFHPGNNNISNHNQIQMIVLHFFSLMTAKENNLFLITIRCSAKHCINLIHFYY